MAQKDEETEQSRRARRRRGALATAEESTELVAEPSPEEEQAPPTAKKKKRKAALESSDQIRDRNKRLREEAAERRRRSRERAAPAQGLDASERMDDALVRSTHAAASFLRRHFSVLQWVIVLGIAGGIGFQVYTYRRDKTEAQASDLLASALAAEEARVGPAEASTLENDGLPQDLRPEVATHKERLDKAIAAYRTAAGEDSTLETKILARLGLAGALYDAAEYQKAREVYQEVKDSELAAKDLDMRARAIEGIGLSHEASGGLAAALKSFGELENVSLTGINALAQYHQARAHFLKGDKPKAKELITKVVEKLAKDRDPLVQTSYLERAARELQQAIDPEAAAASPGSSLSVEQLEKLQKTLSEDPTKLEELMKELRESGAGQDAPAPAAPESSQTP